MTEQAPPAPASQHATPGQRQGGVFAKPWVIVPLQVIVLVTRLVLLVGLVAFLLMLAAHWPCAVAVPALVLVTLFVRAAARHLRPRRTETPRVYEPIAPRWTIIVFCIWGAVVTVLVAIWLVSLGRDETQHFLRSIGEQRTQATPGTP